MKVIKYGGSSIATPDRIRSVIKALIERLNNQEKLYVVFSALGGVTDTLIELSHQAKRGEKIYTEHFEDLKERHHRVIDQLISSNRSNKVAANIFRLWDELQSLLHGISLVKELTLRTLDCIMSFGERASAYLITQAIKEHYLDIDFVDARKLILTDDTFGSARVDISKTYQMIKQHKENAPFSQVVTGFIASTVGGETTTLGRGGSDYTASLFAAALEVEVLEIWTDVNGVMTADPRKVAQAFSVKELSYEEAMEISHFGAKVIYPPTMHPVIKERIPIHICNTFDPQAAGTWIREETESKQTLIKGISSIDPISLVRVQGSGMIGITGISSRLFSILAYHKINIILISQASSEHTICFAVDREIGLKAKQVIEHEFSLEILAGQMETPFIENDLSILAIVGEKMRHRPGISERLFTALGKNGINVIAIAQGSSELNISVVINQSDENKALNAIHDAFFLSDLQTVHLFFIGVGLVGRALLSQIDEREKFLKENHQLKIELQAIANSKKMLFTPSDFSLSTVLDYLEDSQEGMNVSLFIEKMCALNLPNSIFVDCTANEGITHHYKEILQHNISIVTPNKKANASKYKQYKELQGLVKQRGVSFYYETNVGAGLPVINTLKDLIHSGDEILKIEAVLSGTLSYIFNTYNGELPFSEVVKIARERGYTEPDPRDDLNGIDVARKVLILARESGYPLELEEIEVENLVDAPCMEASDLPTFFKELKKLDAQFLKRLEEADHQKKKLCYVGYFERGKCRVLLQSIGEHHPFYQLEGSDNMIVFTTKRYFENPLVVKGPGAGAEVTAAGVFADIMRVCNG